MVNVQSHSQWLLIKWVYLIQIKRTLRLILNCTLFTTELISRLTTSNGSAASGEEDRSGASSGSMPNGNMPGAAGTSGNEEEPQVRQRRGSGGREHAQTKEVNYTSEQLTAVKRSVHFWCGRLGGDWYTCLISFGWVAKRKFLCFSILFCITFIKFMLSGHAWVIGLVIYVLFATEAIFTRERLFNLFSMGVPETYVYCTPDLHRSRLSQKEYCPMALEHRPFHEKSALALHHAPYSGFGSVIIALLKCQTHSVLWLVSAPAAPHTSRGYDVTPWSRFITVPWAWFWSA